MHRGAQRFLYLEFSTLGSLERQVSFEAWTAKQQQGLFIPHQQRVRKIPS